MLGEAIARGAQLKLFPSAQERYGFADLASAYAVAEPVPGPTIEMLAACAGGTEWPQEARMSSSGSWSALRTRPSSTTVQPSSAPMDSLGSPQSPLAPPGRRSLNHAWRHRLLVWDTEIGRVGIIICYDLRFPEAMRTLALSGADIIALPTTGPTGRKRAPVVHAHASAGEPCLRPGVQSLWRGEWLLVLRHSQITDPAATSWSRPSTARNSATPRSPRSRHARSASSCVQASLSSTRWATAARPCTDNHGGL